MPSSVLLRALSDPACGRNLPAPVPALLVDLAAPPRLAAHLRLVHDTAAELTDALAHKLPNVPFDGEAVLFGAAIHDIGKCIYPAELSGPGSAHEEAGYQLLLDRGIPPHLARLARTHASWSTPGIELEDLLVSLADKAWKAKRVEDLEQLTVTHLAKATARDPWDIFMVLDDILTGVAAGADRRLAAQSEHTSCRVPSTPRRRGPMASTKRFASGPPLKPPS